MERKPTCNNKQTCQDAQTFLFHKLSVESVLWFAFPFYALQTGAELTDNFGSVVEKEKKAKETKPGLWEAQAAKIK